MLRYLSAKKTSSGFSLMETVVVLGISVLLLIVLYDVFFISHSSFTIGDRRLELIQNGRIVLDRLSREIRQSIEVVTPLPATKTDPSFPPPAEILFQDGHGLTNVQYLRYYLNGQMLMRQRVVYFFSQEPNTYVYWNAHDNFGNLPQSQAIEEREIAEYFSALQFYGQGLIYVDVYLQKQESALHLYSAIWGRNKRQ